jgi:hypothetical protein
MTHEENLEMLVSQLSELGFHKTNMYEYLDGCAGMETIPFFQRSRIGDDEMSYQLTIKRDGASGLYYPEGYEATLLKTHPVPHGHFDGIDTLKLEQRLKEVNWNEYIPKSTRQDDKAFKVILDVVDLAVWQNKEAQDISKRLQLRYWLHTPVEQDLNVAQDISHYQKTHYFELNKGLDDMQIRAAYNLLSGRSVLKFIQGEPRSFHGHWKKLVNGRLETFPDFDFMAPLKALPLKEVKENRIDTLFIYKLISGDQMNVHLEKDNMPMYLHVNAADQKIQLYDDEWLIRQQRITDQPQKKTSKTPIRQKKPGRNKGRSI